MPYSQNVKMANPSVDDIDALLPQTQCKECEFPGCRPYAQALQRGEVTIDRCPPGGTTTLIALAELLKVDATPYLDGMRAKTRAPSHAFIRENECIGCTKCIQACPVDAIVGSAKKMHTVITDECTGCGLCIEPCPVDCIDMISVNKPRFDSDRARVRFEARNQRLAQLVTENEKAHQLKKTATDQQSNQSYIQAALMRAMAKRNKTSDPNE